MVKYIIMALAILAPFTLQADTESQRMKDRYSIEEWTPIDIEVTFYTDLPEENGQGAVDALGNKLVYGTIAAPREMPKHSIYIIEGYEGVFTNTDVGSPRYIKWHDDNSQTIDMFIPRRKGESRSAYKRRVNNMGRVKTRALIKTNS